MALKFNGRLKAGLGIGVLAVAASHMAQAQEPKRLETVAERKQESYDPAGIRAGSFNIFPKGEVKETYNSNIYAANSEEKSDFITTVSPSVDVKSDFSRHALNFQAGLDYSKYVDHDAEDFTNYNVGADGRLDVLRDTKITGGASYKLLHEDRGSPDATASNAAPVEYNVLSGKLGGSHKINRVSLGLDGAVDRYEFNDVDRTGGGVNVQSNRDRTEYKETGRVGYELVPGYEAFMRTTLNQRNYRLSSTPDRSSTGYEVVGGAALDLTGKLAGDVYAGYMSQEYDGPGLPSINGIAAGGSLRWNVTQLTTISPSVTRSVEETTSTGYSGYISTAAGVSIDHELLRNLIVSGNMKYTNNDYKRTSSTTTDKAEDIYSTGVSTLYKMNRNLYAGGGYEYQYKDSSLVESDTTVHKVYVKGSVQF